MKYLIIYTHPNPKSFNRAVKEEVESALKKQGKEFAVRDLYEIKFNSVLGGSDFAGLAQGKIPEDIKREQEFIKKAGALIFINPIWWFGMPALLKGYIDRVFLRGFAYDVVDGKVKGLLSDKKVMMFNTTGGAQEDYEKFGYRLAIKTNIELGIFEFCGMKVILHKYLFAVPTSTDEQRKEMLADIEGIDFE